MNFPPRLRSVLRALLTGAALLVATGATPALAAGAALTDQVTDETGVLGADGVRVRAALDDLFRSEALRLWVHLVPTTGGVLAEDAARREFTDNGFGPNDMILVVAVEDHRYGWWELTAAGSDRGTATSMPSYEVDALLGSALDPSFRAGDYAGGIVALAQAMEVTVPVARNATPGPTRYDFGGVGPVEDSGPSDDGEWIVLIVVFGMVFVIFGLAAMAATGESGGGGWSSGSGSSGGWSSGGSSWSSSSGSSSGHGGGGGWSGGGSSGGGGGHGGGGGW